MANRRTHFCNGERYYQDYEGDSTAYSGRPDKIYSNGMSDKDKKIAELEATLIQILNRNEELQKERDNLKFERDQLSKQVNELMEERNKLLLENVSLNQASEMFAKEVAEFKGLTPRIRKPIFTHEEFPENPIVARKTRNSRAEENKYDHYDLEIAASLQEEEQNEIESRARFTMQNRGLHPRISQANREPNRLSNSVNPDKMTYEELLALGDKIGHVSKGLKADKFEALPEETYRSYSKRSPEERKCMVCHCEYEDGEALKRLQCIHDFHSECIKKWLTDNKTCPICLKDAI